MSAGLPAPPSPASVLTFQKQGGCASSPATGQAVAGVQGTTTAGLPPGQKLPTGQRCAEELVDPAAHPHPALPLQLPLQAALVHCCVGRQKVPLGQSTACLACEQ